MQNATAQSKSQPLELFFYLTDAPTTSASVYIDVATVEWDSNATTIKSINPPADAKQDNSSLYKPGSEKPVGKTEPQPTAGGRTRFNTTVTVPFNFEQKQIILILVKDAASNAVVGSSTLTLGTLVSNKSKNEKLSFPQNAAMKLKVMHEGVKSEQLIQDKAAGTKAVSQEDITNAKFREYLEGGVQISLDIAIDFTISNGEPSSQFSLHHLSQTGPNLYQKVIMGVLGPLMNYDHDKQIRLFGFGAKPQKGGQTSHCFNLNQVVGHPKPVVGTPNELFAVYNQILQKVEFHGPTFFEPLLKTFIEESNLKFKANNNHYGVLLILTDGFIHDMDETIDLLVDSSATSPVSIIIVGIGKEDFADMHKLDSDSQALVNGKGVKAARDLVQFVEFSKFEAKPAEELAKETLIELPKSVVEFFTLQKIAPKPVPKQQ